MDPFEVIEKAGAEIACSTAILNVEGKRTILARVVDGEMKLTEEGEVLARAYENAEEKKPAKKAKAAPKAKAAEPAPAPTAAPEVDQDALDLDAALDALAEED